MCYMFFLPDDFFNDTRKLTICLTWNKGYSCMSFPPSWADNAINWIIIYPVNSAIDFLILIFWIVIYPVGSTIRSFNNRGLENSNWAIWHWYNSDFMIIHSSISPINVLLIYFRFQMTDACAWMFSLTGNITWVWFRWYLLLCTTTTNQVK